MSAAWPCMSDQGSFAGPCGLWQISGKWPRNSETRPARRGGLVRLQYGRTLREIRKYRLPIERPPELTISLENIRVHQRHRLILSA